MVVVFWVWGWVLTWAIGALGTVGAPGIVGSVEPVFGWGVAGRGWAWGLRQWKAGREGFKEGGEQGSWVESGCGIGDGGGDGRGEGLGGGDEGRGWRGGAFLRWSGEGG